MCLDVKRESDCVSVTVFPGQCYITMKHAWSVHSSILDRFISVDISRWIPVCTRNAFASGHPFVCAAFTGSWVSLRSKWQFWTVAQIPPPRIKIKTSICIVADYVSNGLNNRSTCQSLESSNGEVRSFQPADAVAQPHTQGWLWARADCCVTSLLESWRPGKSLTGASLLKRQLAQTWSCELVLLDC